MPEYDTVPRGIDSRTCLSIKSNLAISRKKLASRKHVRIATVRWGRTGYPPTYPRASPEPKASEFARDHPTVLFGFVLYYCLLFIVYCLLLLYVCLFVVVGRPIRCSGFAKFPYLQSWWGLGIACAVRDQSNTLDQS